jgi:hypothetical protein
MPIYYRWDRDAEGTEARLYPTEGEWDKPNPNNEICLRWKRYLPGKGKRRMDTPEVFDTAVAEIGRAYEDLGHELGWKFLFSPVSILSKDTRLCFVGLNPGGSRYYPPVPSVEEGNAYRVERWGDSGRINPLQTQVRRLYEVLSKMLGTGSAVDLMDGTLTANFCPFRSPEWKLLPKKPQSVAFSSRLWRGLFDHISPSAIICLTDRPFEHFGEVLNGRGYRKTETLQEPVGWGNVTYSQARFRSENDEIFMVRLPHLSQYKIFSRPQSRQAIDRFTDAIAEVLSGES